MSIEPPKAAVPTDPESLADELGQELEIVHQIVGHRLKHGEVQRILETLDENDRRTVTVQLADILRKSSALLEVSKRVSDSLSLDILLPRMVEIVCEFLDADRATLFMHDAKNEELYSRVAAGDLSEEIRFPDSAGIAGSVFTTGEAVNIPDCYADERFNPEVDKKTGYKTNNMLCAPIMRSSGERIGVAQVLNRHTGGFDEEDLKLLGAITTQAAAAFVNAQLHEDIARVRTDESKLLEITVAISRELNLSKLLQKIMAAVTEILDADRSTLFMHDKKSDELWSQVVQGVGMAEIRFPAHLGIAGSVFKSGETINIPDAYADERFNPAVDKKTGYKTDTILCMPVNNKQDQTIGVVQVLNKNGGPFLEVDERRLGAFSSQASIAIENAQLFEEIMRMKNYNESILESMSSGVVTLNADAEVVTANAAALRLFRLEGHAEEMVGKAAEELFAGKNTWIAETIDKVRESLEQEIAMDTDLWFDGEESLSANISTVPLSSTAGEHIGCLLIIEDITTEKRQRATMARYMSKEVADKLLEEGEDALGGQLQTASVLFTDIRSFTTISEKLGAHRTVQMLNEYFTLMVDIIMDNGGILDKYIGDAIMAVYGAPFASDQDADNAVRTAIGMLEILRPFNRERAAAGEQEVLIGIGVNTDGVLSGNIGSPKRMDYTVIGDGVNLAARLEGANKAYGTQILISELTRQALKGEYLTREVDRIVVKGKTEPVGVHEILDHHDQESFPNREELLYLYNSGLVYYRQRDWAKAEQIFHDAVILAPRDGLSAMYRDRCTVFMAEPPADDWDGVWTMKTK